MGVEQTNRIEEFQEIELSGGRFEFKKGQQGGVSIRYEGANPYPTRMFQICVSFDGKILGTVPFGGIGQVIPYPQPSLLAWIISDRHGMFGRRCPKCESYFRTNSTPGDRFCPYCGHSDESAQFLTSNQLKCEEKVSGTFSFGTFSFPCQAPRQSSRSVGILEHVAAITLGLAIALTPSLACAADARASDLLWPTPRTCRIEQLKLSAADAAVLCAERFIARNGYTQEAPVSDEAQIASESIEWARSIYELLASRRGTLEPRAYGICDSGHQSRRYTVVFRYAGGKSPDRARAVTMTSEFTELRVQHQTFIIPDTTTRQQPGCRLLDMNSH